MVLPVCYDQEEVAYNIAMSEGGKQKAKINLSFEKVIKKIMKTADAKTKAKKKKK